MSGLCPVEDDPSERLGVTAGPPRTAVLNRRWPSGVAGAPNAPAPDRPRDDVHISRSARNHFTTARSIGRDTESPPAGVASPVDGIHSTGSRAAQWQRQYLILTRQPEMEVKIGR
jgi:hypothetical protein